jgi:hypothetical protein
MIPFRSLSSSDQEIIRQAISAVFGGTFIDDREFYTRYGADKTAFRDALARWPLLDDSSEDADDLYVINGALNEICYGRAFPKREWGVWFTVSPQVVEEVYKRWEQAQKQ